MSREAARRPLADGRAAARSARAARDAERRHDADRHAALGAAAPPPSLAARRHRRRRADRAGHGGGGALARPSRSHRAGSPHAGDSRPRTRDRPGTVAGPSALDGRSFLFVSGDSLYVRPLEGGGPRVVATGKELHSPAWSPDGHRIAYVLGNVGFVTTSSFGNIAASSVWVVSADAGAPMRVTDDPSLNVSPTWAPSGGGLLYISNREGG